MSLYRLNPNIKEESGKELLIKRTIKEIIHELGHCYGLSHCTNNNCVMSASNSILEVDNKDRDFCGHCKKILGKQIIKVRPFMPSDLTRVYEIESRSFKDPYHPLFLLNLYQTYNQGFFVAEINSTVRGYATSRILTGKGHVLAIAIDKGYTRRGIGTALINQSEEYFKKNGIKTIELEVRMSNMPAIKFYKSQGFREARIIPQYYKDGENGILLIKQLKLTAT